MLSRARLKHDLLHWISVRDFSRDLAGNPVFADPDDVCERINWLEWKLSRAAGR